MNDPYWERMIAPVMRNDMNAVVAEHKEPQLPAPVARRGITEAQWLTLKNSLFPGAKGESVVMVWDYCAARNLDPLKKPCHIVPMRVRQGDEYVWRDVVMPGIYEYRTTANRTGLYMGQDDAVLGPIVEHLGRMVPEFCKITVYKWNSEARAKCAYTGTAYFDEYCATTKDKKTGELHLNDRWNKAPRQMLEKCAEAAALRKAFPDELGGTHTVEEMEGQVIDSTAVEIDTRRVDPRGDLSGVDWEIRDKHVSAIADVLHIDKEEIEISRQLNEYVTEFLQPFPELYIAVNDKLAADGIISKKNFKAYLEKAGRHAP